MNLRDKKIITIFTLIYLLIPLFTGLLEYKWQPNESFNSEKHVCVSDNGELCDFWKDNFGNTYNKETFAEHKRSEARRLSFVWFLYGLIGCLFFAGGKKQQGKNFYEFFGKAIFVNLGLVVFVVLMLLE